MRTLLLLLALAALSCDAPTEPGADAGGGLVVVDTAFTAIDHATERARIGQADGLHFTIEYSAALAVSEIGAGAAAVVFQRDGSAFASIPGGVTLASGDASYISGYRYGPGEVRLTGSVSGVRPSTDPDPGADAEVSVRIAVLPAGVAGGKRAHAFDTWEELAAYYGVGRD